jgi:signal transduction histidine kinase
MQWKFTQGTGSSLANLISVVLGCLCGYWLKRQDEFRRTLQSQHYELKLRNQELQSSRLLLVKQDEVERRLLAADLHDQVLNDLKAVVDKFNRYETEHDSSLAVEINRDLQKSMGEVREIMDNLCPLILEHFGLPAAIEQCLEHGAKRAGFDYRLINKTADEELEKLSSVQQQLLFRLIQESITNICKHAQAEMVKIFIETNEQRLFLRVIDDGKGLPPDKDGLDGSRGVLYMRLRAGLIGARVEWLPTNPRGTTVEISLPLTAEAQPAAH